MAIAIHQFYMHSYVKYWQNKNLSNLPNLRHKKNPSNVQYLQILAVVAIIVQQYR